MKMCNRIAAAMMLFGACVAGSVRAETLYTNGSIVTNAGVGPGGYDISQASDDFNTLGFSVLSPTRLADDFVVPAGGWLVSGVTVNGYVVGSYSVPPAGSPLTGLTVNLWRGQPEGIGSELVATSSTLAGNHFSGIFRVSFGAANFGNTQRPVFDITASFPNTLLTPGSYALDYSLSGGGNIFSPMIMTGTPANPITFAGNAQRKLDPNGSWVTLFGGLGAQGVDFPFQISGTVAPEPSATLLLAGMGMCCRWRRRR